MKRFLLLALLLLCLNNSGLLSQSVSELKKDFYYAESRILYEDWREALPQYQLLLGKYPGNSNYKYRIGQCFLNIPGEKDKAISYLEDAVSNIDPNYSEGKFSEKGAPYDALYHLANAYRINYQLDKAIETYKKFLNNLNNKVYDSTVVNLQIQSCLNAKELMRNPVYLKSTNIGKPINQKDGEFYPVVSDDGNMLVFARSEPFYDAILYSTLINGQWSEPQNMNEILKVDMETYPTSLSHDGKELYIYSSADLDGTIYSTKYENGTWLPPVRLNENINTKYWESHATISHDNKRLYFTSNRKGGYGGLDIYVSTRDDKGDWGPAVNLGPVINTPYNEEAPFLTDNDKTLYFSSRGHYNMGGYDIFYSSLLSNGEWSIPLNAGYPLNTTDDDVFYKPVKDGNEGYIALYNPEGFGKQDIYHIEIFSDEHPRKFFITGSAQIEDLRKDLREPIKIIIRNSAQPDQKIVVYADSETGKFSFEVPQGNYKISYEADGTEKTVRNLDLPTRYPSDSIALPGTILPKADHMAELNIKGSHTVTVKPGDTLAIPLQVEPKSVLTVEHWKDDKLLSTTQYSILDSAFTYKMVPLAGENKVTFSLNDKFNNTASADLFINREKIFSELPFLNRTSKVKTSNEQINAFMEALKRRANERMLTVINEADTANKKFNTPDDLLDLLRVEARNKNVNSEEVDKLALEVAVKDNILTQAAVNLIASYATGELKQILTGLDIYKEGLKTWTDLLDYISAHSNGRIKPGEVQDLAMAILTGTDSLIALIREKILAFSQSYREGNLIRESVTSADQSGSKVKERWLHSFYNEALHTGLTPEQLSKMFEAISSLPGTQTEQYLRDLAALSEEPLTTSLGAIDLRKEKITSPEKLLRFIIENSDKVKYPEDAVFKSIANLILSKNLSPDMLSSLFKGSWGTKIIASIAIIGIGFVLFLIILFLRRRKKKEENPAK